MSLTIQENRNTFTGNGSATDFEFVNGDGAVIPVFSEDDLDVYVDSVLKTLNSDYTVTINNDTFAATVEFGTAPDNLAVVLIVRSINYTQTSEYTNNTVLDPTTLENGLDRLVMQTQQLNSRLGRSIIFADSVTDISSTEITFNRDERAFKFLTFDDQGDLQVSGTIGANRGSWSSDGVEYNLQDFVRVINDGDGAVHDPNVGNYGSVYQCIQSHTSSPDLTESKPALPVGDAIPDNNYWKVIIDGSYFATKAQLAETSGAGAATSATEAAASEELAEDWANLTDATVGETSEYSAKEYAVGTTVAVGSSKDWATITGTDVDGTEYSAKEYAIGTTVSTGSAKDWASKLGDPVSGTDYSAKFWATHPDVLTVVNNIVNIGKVANVDTAVSAVADIDSDVSAVAANEANINIVASNIATISAKVSKSGDTMTGHLTLNADPTSNFHASTKQYTDTKTSKSGDTMTGHLTLNADPTNSLHASTKQYTDTKATALAIALG